MVLKICYQVWFGLVTSFGTVDQQKVVDSVKGDFWNYNYEIGLNITMNGYIPQNYDTKSTHRQNKMKRCVFIA